MRDLWKKRVRRVALDIVLMGGMIYVGISSYMFFMQSRVMFQPSREMGGTPKEAGLAYEEVTLTSGDGTKICGWYVPREKARGVVLHCHGNGGNISDRLDTLRALHDMGLAVFIFDYRGYGKSEGKPTEEGVYQDAESAWEYLTEVKKVPAGRIIIQGHSLGGAIAAHLAKQHRAGAVVLENTFTSARDIAEEVYPWLPVRLILRYKFDTAGYIAGHEYPLLIVHSVDDEVVPFKLGKKLYEGTNEPKVFLEMRGTHGEGFDTSAKIYREGWKRFLGDAKL